VDELPEQARFANPRLAHDGHEPAVPLAGPGKERGQLVDLAVATDEAAQAAPRCGIQARAHGLGARHLVRLDGLADALHVHGADGLHADVALDEPQRIAGDQDGAGNGHLLHARGQVGGLPDGRVVHVQVAADGAHHDGAGVQPHADHEHGRVSAPDLLGVLLHALLHPERRIARPHGVVLVRDGRTEEGHDAVAHDLVDGALVAMHGLHHQLEDGIEDALRLLGIAPREQLQRSLQVGEEHGDLLPLALERALRGEDLLGEMSRRVRLGRGEPRLPGRLAAHGGSALVAEARSGRQIVAARAARPARAHGTATVSRRLRVVNLLAVALTRRSPRARRGPARPPAAPRRSSRLPSSAC
jgi:hypothetical protein